MTTKMKMKTKLSHPQLALLGIAGVGIINVLSNGSMFDFVDNIIDWNQEAHIRRASINVPYAPYKGAIEPPESHRELSAYRNYNNGTIKCWSRSIRGPERIPADVDFTNTIVVGYPGADKRVVVRQMEIMTRLSGRDAWDFQMLGMTKQPFIKTNYPHHEGVWGWQDRGDQVMLVVRNIRKNIDSYHDIIADIDFAKTWVERTDKEKNTIAGLYEGDLYAEHYARWRDERTMDEIGWYGWLIDYWMEGGILRDYFDHKLTTAEHWDRLRRPETETYGELQWDVNNCEGDVLPIVYDQKCNPANTAQCTAKVIISAERLMDLNATTAHIEHRKIGTLLSQTEGVSDHLIGEDAWDCLYDLIIGNDTDKAADPIQQHVISTRHLNKMVQQLTRLIDKYSVFDPETNINWTVSEQAEFLVEILIEHRTEIQAELDATSVEQVWPHPPKPNWVVFPKCGEDSRRAWDYNYAHESSGLVFDMFPEDAR